MTGEITQAQKRQQIVDLENLMLSIDGCEVGDNNTCPLKHSFSDGIYVREIFIPKGSIVVGKIHKHEHPNFLMSGTVKIVTEFEDELLTGPLSIISKAGTKRALYAITDLVWITVHTNKTNTKNIEAIEKEIIAKSYDEYEAYVTLKNKIGIVEKIKKILKLWHL